jgi:RND family efflux transporter MFP subunit
VKSKAYRLPCGVNKGLVVCAAIALAALPMGCGKKEEAAQKKAAETVAISLAPARQQSVQRTIDVVGTLYGDEEAQISAKVAGRITKLMADVGDHVDAGATLAQVDPTDYDLVRRSVETSLQQSLAKLGLSALPDEKLDLGGVPTVVQARLQAENSEARLGRSEKLFQQQPPLISEQDYADARTKAQVDRAAYEVALLIAKTTLAEVRSRQADLAIAERRLADATVRAPQPTAGSTAPRYGVAARLVSVGEYVKDGTALFRVVADGTIRFRASVPERYLAEVKLEQPATVRVEAYPDAFQGVVKRINPQIDRDSRSFEVEIVVPNPKGLLRSGAFARGSIATHVDENVVFIPQEAVVSFAGVRKAFTVADGKAVEHQIATGIRDGAYLEITQGLDKAQDVVMAGAGRLANGTPVTLKATTRPAEK